MSTHHHTHLASAVAILKKYSGDVPFHQFIKKYFSVNKKFGSKDRKQITSLCYNCFRLGLSATGIPLEEKILLGTFLCENKQSAFLKNFKPEWNDLVENPLQQKLSMINYRLLGDNIFPFKDELSKGVDVEKFSLSFLHQPKLFLRARPGNKDKVTGKLAGAGISYELRTGSCIALPNASKIDSIIKLDEEAVVQDYNSQRVGEYMKIKPANPKLPTTIWDCCAASGGKSIMAFDINPNINLTVSDKRESIIQNLKNRFAKAGIKKYYSFVADLENSKFKIQNSKFDFIICDAPCTGSGTWARTPEQLYYFKKNEIEKYAALQKKIIQHIVPCLKPGGNLLYITCSVFKKENEEVENFIIENSKLTLIRSEVLTGYEMQSDTMFAALFKK